jgi:hypothetical protein
MTPTTSALHDLQSRYPTAGWHRFGPAAPLLTTADLQISVAPSGDARLPWSACRGFGVERLGRTAVEAVDALGRVAS